MTDRLRGQATPPPDNKEQAARLDSLSEKVAMLTAKLTAAETQNKPSRGASSKELKPSSPRGHCNPWKRRRSTPRCLRLSLMILAPSLSKSVPGCWSRSQPFGQTPASLPTAEKTISAVVESPTVARASPPRFSRTAQQYLPLPTKPATVPIRQSVPRATGQAATPPTAVKPVPLRRNTLSILKPGGNIK